MQHSRHVTEIVARLGTTIVDVRHVDDGTYRVGSGPGCELATAGMTMFPIVTGRRVRAIVGMPARVVPAGGNGAPFTGEHELAIGDSVELVIGLVHVTIALVPAPAAPLAHPAIEKRPFIYGAGSLVTHLAAIAAILAFVAPKATPPKKPSRRPVAYKTAPEVEKPAKTSPAKAASSQHAATAAASEHARGGGTGLTQEQAMANMGAEFAKLANGIDLRKAMADVDPPLTAGEIEQQETHEFGGTYHKVDPGIQAINHRYKTVAHGHGAGDDFDLGAHEPAVTIAMCDKTKGCTANSNVRDEIGDRKWSVAACYTDAKLRTGGNVVVDFEIDTDGKVTRARGVGLGKVGPCVAKLVAGIAFNGSIEPISVHYPMTFTPRAG